MPQQSGIMPQLQIIRINYVAFIHSQTQSCLITLKWQQGIHVTLLYRYFLPGWHHTKGHCVAFMDDLTTSG